MFACRSFLRVTAVSEQPLKNHLRIGFEGKRPVPIETLERTLDEIERSLQELGEKEVSSSQIGDAVLAKLRTTDEVAYVRFASVYLSFRDASELMNEVQRLVRSKGGQGS